MIISKGKNHLEINKINRICYIIIYNMKILLHFVLLHLGTLCTNENAIRNSLWEMEINAPSDSFIK